MFFYFLRLILVTSLSMNLARQFPKIDLMIQMLKERREILTLSKQVQHTMENGLVDSEMGMVSRNGQMALSTKDIGKIIEPTVRENSFILMVISMMVIGSMIKPMVSVSIIISMVPCTKAAGEMISNMEKAKKAGQMDPFTKDFIWPVKNTEWDYIAGMMEADIMENGLKIKSKDLVPTVG